MNRRRVVLSIGVIAIVVVAGALLFPRYAGGGKVSPGAAFSQAMLARVPEGAQDVILIPAFAATVHRLEGHPLGRVLLNAAGPGQHLSLIGSAVGNAAVISFHTESGSGFILKMGDLRRSLLRMFGFLLPKPWDEFYVENGLVIVGGSSRGASTPPVFAAFGSDLKGELFLYEPAGSHASFPPMATPNLSAVLLVPGAITVESRSPGEPRDVAVVPPMRLLRDAMCSAVLSSAPDALKNLDRFFPIKLGPLLEHGGLLALYKVDAKKFMPKPEGIIALPGDGTRQHEVEQLVAAAVGNLHFGDISLNRQSTRQYRGVTVQRTQTIGITLEYAVVPGLVLLSFDKSSMDHFLDDQQETPASPDAAWSVRVDPAKAADAIDALRGQQLSFLLGEGTDRKLESAARGLRLARNARLVLIEKRNAGPMPAVFTTIQAK